ncbi:tRNA glutamyl-Q(34) synthetase GluQRS [Bifidobacterium avesanii]|uniref:Glutamyl-Q tRNA(Asp) synthetase n=1 Tax=Bifidobacterium avesanii TaxID=1798157 RepID=A0A7K3TGI6_9BIFI|nr:tRNA glutamyl-Q(34) synthetase GluQRS [Bifidobacterium avesanii]KAB8294438.1 glutamyl-Q tRNA(Asp) ligase [Bifidobacterium avesanii]NEG77730.1 tRNA glutamyl-Q(34) synthetase GluQRS [Bifidobacterium avesanii]
MSETNGRPGAPGKTVGRFAPTPSGRMHVGNAYAMLAAWLSARAAGRASGAGSRMVLRIEDIDRPRVVKDADRWIMDDLAWLGLDWDGEPVYQSARLDRYEQVFGDLCDRGLVYPCFCSRADIRAASAPNEGDGFVVYPGTCRRLIETDPDEVRRCVEAGEQHSWRVAVPEEGIPSLSATVTFDDRLFGPQRYDLARDVGDTVIRRSDGLFAYQLAVTVDDLDMGVTDIVRGRDLLRSTALQLYIRDLMQDAGSRAPYESRVPQVPPAPRPSFAHLPLIDNAQGRRMAKREHSMDLGFLRSRGVRPEQVVGYCAWLLGLGGPQPEPAPMTAAEALDAFVAAGGWEGLRSDDAGRAGHAGRPGLADRVMPDQPAALEPPHHA